MTYEEQISLFEALALNGAWSNAACTGYCEAVRRIAPFGIVLLQRDGAFLFVKSDPDCHAKRPYAFPKSFFCSFLCV